MFGHVDTRIFRVEGLWACLELHCTASSGEDVDHAAGCGIWNEIGARQMDSTSRGARVCVQLHTAMVSVENGRGVARSQGFVTSCGQVVWPGILVLRGFGRAWSCLSQQCRCGCGSHGRMQVGWGGRGVVRVSAVHRAGLCVQSVTTSILVQTTQRAVCVSHLCSVSSRISELLSSGGRPRSLLLHPDQGVRLGFRGVGLRIDRCWGYGVCMNGTALCDELERERETERGQSELCAGKGVCG